MSRSPLVVSVLALPEAGIEVAGAVPLAALAESPDDRIACPGPLAFNLHLAPVRGGVLVRGRLQTVVRCRCDRCLTDYDKTLLADDVCHLFTDLPEPVVDLTAAVREDILLTFPQQCLCRPDCRGLCPACGRNRNARACSCSPPGIDEGVWSTLDELHLPGAAD